MRYCNTNAFYIREEKKATTLKEKKVENEKKKKKCHSAKWLPQKVHAACLSTELSVKTACSVLFSIKTA